VSFWFAFYKFTNKSMIFTGLFINIQSSSFQVSPASLVLNQAVADALGAAFSGRATFVRMF